MAVPTSTIRSADRWLSLHIFYASGEDRLLVDCILPLVRSLRTRRRIARYFFIRYWLEGPHLRLRLLPAPGASAEAVAAEAEARLAAFVARHPAPDPPGQPAPEVYRRLFLAEYDQADWDRRYGRGGQMPVRDNNSLHWVGYEPEYRRYGGLAGVELAEWHFEASSDLVLRLLAERRPSHPARLGLSAQLGLILGLAFLGDGDPIVEFFERYRDFWVGTYGPYEADLHPAQQAAYVATAERLRRRVGEIRAKVRAAVDDGGDAEQPRPEPGWLRHCLLLRRRVTELVGAGRLQLRVDGGQEMLDQHAILSRLLHSYLHMTNNRLGVSVIEEAYIAQLLGSALANEARNR